MSIIAEAKRVIQVEADALLAMAARAHASGGEEFLEADAAGGFGGHRWIPIRLGPVTIWSRAFQKAS